MIIYNITISVEDSIKKDWLDWMKHVHIPEVMSTGLFLKSQINRLIGQGESDNTFAVAYTCSNMKDFHEYQIKFASKLQKKYLDRYGQQATAFRTLLEVIHEI